MKVERKGSGTHMLGQAAFDELEQALSLERRYAAATDSLLAALRSSATLEDAWPTLLQTFAGLTSAKSARLWLNTAGRLTPQLALRVPPGDEPADVALTLALGVEPSGKLSTVSLVAPGHLLARGLAGADDRVLCLSFERGDNVSAVLCFALAEHQVPSELEQARLAALGEHVGAAIAERLVHEDLTQSIRARDEVLGIVAHDLRNPLNVITTASSMLHQRLPDQRARRSVERILRAAQRAEHLIDDLLDVSAIESGHFAVEKRQFDAATAVLAAIEMQQGLAASSSVILASDLAPGLPPIQADGERVLEVLENLVGNAIKFTPAGGTILIGARAQGAELVLWVKDTGPGIPPEQIPHLFDRFWQASKGDRRGAGLGLTICRAIVDAHGGRIWVESELGVGSTVFFSLPALGLLPKRIGDEVTNILLVDDRPENLMSLKAVLERPDYRLVSASSGEEALRLMLRETFAAVLMDIAMPGMDGLEVASHMKALERSRDVPIIFITAFGNDPAEIHRAYSAGGADYLVKPLDAEIVRRKVAVFVDLSRRRNERARQTAGG
jgi:signal transduction histidine kinase/ActR/RegA family two-component response regulator